VNDLLLPARLQAALGDAYVLERELGGGGMSRLFVATERSLNRQVVIKVLPPELASEVSAARFKKEIEVARSCSIRTSSRSWPRARVMSSSGS
jgi:Serine/threonine protein kinase